MYSKLGVLNGNSWESDRKPVKLKAVTKNKVQKKKTNYVEQALNFTWHKKYTTNFAYTSATMLRVVIVKSFSGFV